MRKSKEHRCVCTVGDNLVQEWVSKARAVAKSKGFTVRKRPPSVEPEIGRSYTKTR